MLDLLLIETKNSAIKSNAIILQADRDTSDPPLQAIKKRGVDEFFKSIGKVFDRYKLIIEITSR